MILSWITENFVCNSCGVFTATVHAVVRARRTSGTHDQGNSRHDVTV